MSNQLSCPVCSAEIDSSGASSQVGQQAPSEARECWNCGTPIKRFPKDTGAIGTNWIVNQPLLRACPHCQSDIEWNYEHKGPSITKDDVLTPSGNEQTNCPACERAIFRWEWAGQRWFKRLPEPPEIKVFD